VCWQLSYELKCEVFAFTATDPASRDFKYRDQIRDSSAAAPRDISEGLGRFRPREFARFLEFARGSLMETRTSLVDGRHRGYLTQALYSRLSNLARAALKATTNLMRSKQRQADESSPKPPSTLQRSRRAPRAQKLKKIRKSIPARSTRRNGDLELSDCASEKVARRRKMRDR
jgi:four helix bundle protein